MNYTNNKKQYEPRINTANANKSLIIHQHYIHP